MKWSHELSELIFPCRCVACGSLGTSLCSRCRREWNPHLYFTHIGSSPHTQLEVTSAVLYSSTAQKIILGAKESHFKRCDVLVSAAITHAVGHAIRRERIEYLIPIPSRKSAARLRGRQFITEMCADASVRFSIPISSPLLHTRKVRDQSGLQSSQRWNNLEGAFVVDGDQLVTGKVLLIDDLVTTGATLCEAARALRYAGIQVMGAVTAAVAQPLR